MYDYLQDKEFLKEFDKIKVKTHYAKLILLDFNEKPIEEVNGIFNSGNLSIDGNSALRRTINLNMLAQLEHTDLTRLNNLISLNKKISIMIGYKNTLPEYIKKYGDIIWFPCGIFLISSASLSYSINGCQISIKGKDKIAQLDGTVGGMFPATVVFHEKYIEEENGDITILKPTIFEIIQEAVNHFGKEDINNIIINDLEKTVKKIVRYVGDKPIYFDESYNSFTFEEKNDFTHEYVYGDDIGYMNTDFTYPGELVFPAGGTVVQLLDKICELLGNYEYFYNVYGKFIFQEKKNYLNKKYTPEKNNNSLNSNLLDNFNLAFCENQFMYTFNNTEQITSITLNPKYDNIKNDFIIWGEQESISDQKKQIRYHLVIDKKPQIDLANQYLYKIVEDNKIIKYKVLPEEIEKQGYTLIGKPSQEWREELYRQCLIAQPHSGDAPYYAEEMLSEWRFLYDTMKEEWIDGWNPDVFNNPEKLRYWIDFIDSNTLIGEYSVSNIGRRTKIINNKNVKTLFTKAIPDIIFIESSKFFNLQEKELDEYTTLLNLIGQKYCVIKDYQSIYFATSFTGFSAHECAMNLLYEYLIYNSTISINCTPKFYLEPNNVIAIQDPISKIQGNFIVQSMNLPLNFNGIMQINANEQIKKV